MTPASAPLHPLVEMILARLQRGATPETYALDAADLVPMGKALSRWKGVTWWWL